MESDEHETLITLTIVVTKSSECPQLSWYVSPYLFALDCVCSFMCVSNEGMELTKPPKETKGNYLYLVESMD